ncbi:Seipin family [Melia azedarach]|uniref:Seipin family n=1 Tax=Melia azedarach TaxID=155640 RepID=A0ACC1WWW1_MELAZ|nr:Seipin family [Melia azedarach]
MDLLKPSNNDDDEEEFFDAVDDFPFYDFIPTDQLDQSTSESKEISSTLRRRSSSQRRTENNVSKAITGEGRHRTRRNPKEKETNLITCESTADRFDSVQPGISEEKNKESTVTNENQERAGDSVDSLGEPPQSSSWLDCIVGLVIKAIAFQFNLLISLILFPFTVLSYYYMVIMDPFHMVKRGREYLFRKLYNLLNLICGYFSSMISEWFKGHESIWKLIARFGWGLFWAIYVCTILCGLLIFSTVISGILVRFLVEKPLQIKEMLNFDYTKNSPVAFLPIMACAGAFCGDNCEEKKELSRGLGSRVIPVTHKLQVTVKLTLPESDYNRKLGMFQVRVEFLSANGEKLSSSSRPCMLQFKSEPVRHLLTFFKVAPIVSGYVSETQTLNVKFRGFVERDVPTACLKAMIEQRAEFRPGAGVYCTNML